LALINGEDASDFPTLVGKVLGTGDRYFDKLSTRTEEFLISTFLRNFISSVSVLVRKQIILKKQGKF
jgi:hypothetical protein